MLKKLRLSGFYFATAAFLGIFGPYWGVYLDSLHYSPLQIGIILALPALANIIAPAISGSIADKREKRADMIRGLSLACAILFSISLIKDYFLWQLITLFTVFLCSTSITPLLESTTLDHLQGQTHQYGKIRFWGTVGFLTMTLMGGYLSEAFSIAILPKVLLFLFIFMALWSFLVKEEKTQSHKKTHENFLETSQKKEIIILFASCFCIVMAHGTYGAFYSIHLVEHGYSKMMIGWLWIGAAVSEALCFMLSSTLIKKFGAKKIYLISFFVAGCRFPLIGWGADSLWTLASLQLLHGLTFSLHHAASMVYLEKLYPAAMLSRAQALYLGGPYGVGAALGGIAAGALWTGIGSTWVFSLAGCLALLGLLITYGLPSLSTKPA